MLLFGGGGKGDCSKGKKIVVVVPLYLTYDFSLLLFFASAPTLLIL